MSTAAPTITTPSVGPRLLRQARHGVAGAWRNDKAGFGAMALLVLIVLLALLAPIISPYDPLRISSDNLVAPGRAHLFGTDQFGRDIFSRVLWGGRLTLLAPAVGIGISTVVGVCLGLLAGYSTRWVSGLIMRTMDVLLAFPGLLLALIVVAILGPGLVNVMVAIGISFIPVFARVVYGSTLSAKGQDYVTAARTVGCSPLRIMMRHILPNVMTQIVVIASSAIGWGILTATTLNFLGFGVKLPTPEWGADLSAGKDWLEAGWWISTFPGLAITVTILAANYIGDHVAAALEPNSHWRESVQQVGRDV
jgi:peptide/nickel transport system permease protein